MITTHQRRMQTFMDEGLCEQEARSLADQMYIRDQEDGLDDRRVCFECTNYINRKCVKILDKFGKPTMPLRFMLQRCEYFDLRGKKQLSDEELHQIDASNQHQGRDE
jgi:hypothetical protein